MLTRKLTSLWGKSIAKQFHTAYKNCKEFENPYLRALRIVKEEFTMMRPNAFNEEERNKAVMGLFPRHADIVIIGGGPIGASIAFWLKEKTSREGISVVVIEKDLKVLFKLYSLSIIILQNFLVCQFVDKNVLRGITPAIFVARKH